MRIRSDLKIIRYQALQQKTEEEITKNKSILNMYENVINAIDSEGRVSDTVIDCIGFSFGFDHDDSVDKWGELVMEFCPK
jgi:hypothetical protein